MKSLGKVSILIMTIFLHYCFTSNTANRSRESTSTYLIKSIDSVDNWYLIYAAKKHSFYEIVVRKEKQLSLKCKSPISVGESYRLELHSRKDEVPVINGLKIKPMNYLDIQCYSYEKNTVICIDPKKVFMIYTIPPI